MKTSVNNKAYPGVSPSTVGAISELTVCAYLMSRGYAVYRAESPSAPFDIAGYKDGVVSRIEVKTLNTYTWRTGANVSIAFSWPKNYDWDILAVVDPRDRRVMMFDAPAVYADVVEKIRSILWMPPGVHRGPKRGNVERTSVHKGVHWHVRMQKWVANVRIGGRTVYLGSFESEDDALMAYVSASQNVPTHAGDPSRIDTTIDGEFVESGPSGAAEWPPVSEPGSGLPNG